MHSQDNSAAEVVIFSRRLSLEPTSTQCAVTKHNKSESDPDISDLEHMTEAQSQKPRKPPDLLRSLSSFAALF